MAARIPEDKIQEIRERTDIVQLVSSYLPLKKSGSGNHLGLCPFHSEKTPSFNVNAPRQIFHCFGCGVGGNAFSFLMRMEGLSFPDAVRRLGEQAGVEIAEQDQSPEDLRRQQERERLERVLECAADFYHQILLDGPEGAPARRYLRGRGYDGETVRAYRLGFAPARWEALAEHLKEKNFSLDDARALGLIRPGKQDRGDYDLFRNRVLFPIVGLSGKVVAFGGRVLDDSLPKYINSPESALYHKGRILYGLAQAREEMRRRGEVIVVEGYFDQLALAREGFGNAVATCGTALTEEHGKILKRYAGRVLLLFDQDSAGQTATFRAMDVLLSSGLSVRTVELDAGEDPDSYLRSKGPERFKECLNASRPVLEVFMESLLEDNGDDVEGRARAAQEVLDKLKKLPSDIERNLYLKTLSERTGLGEEFLRRKIQARPQRSEFRERRSFEPSVPLSGKERSWPARGETQGADWKNQKWLVYLMATAPKVLEQVRDEGLDVFFIDAQWRAVADRLMQHLQKEGARIETLMDDDLPDEQRSLLSGILVLDEGAFAEDRERIFEGCRTAAEKARLKSRLKELSEQMQKSIEARDFERHSELQIEFIETKRKIQAFFKI